MAYHFDSAMIARLADILKGKLVNSEAVVKALALICESSVFQQGFIYELNFSDRFDLKEYYSSKFPEFPESIPVEQFEMNEMMIISPSDNGLTSPSLELYAAESLLIAPVTDEEGRTYGLIILTQNTAQEYPKEKVLQDLLAPLSMLVRYVGIRMYQNKLSQAQRTLENILDNTGIDIYVNDFLNHDILYVNKSMAAPYGGKEYLMGQKCWQALFPGQTGPCEFCPQKKLINESGVPSKVYSWDYQRPFDGSWFRVFSAAFRWTDGRLAHVVSSADITDNKRNEAVIERMANYDQLTDLPNRRMLVRDCEQRIDKATATEKGYLMFFDIDGFKEINDNLGHDAGDEFLVQLGQFFSEIPLLKDTIYRNGGDEFVAIVGGEEISKNNIQSLANFILERFKRPFKLQNGDVFSNTSIGVACFPDDGITAEELLRKADMAMYQAKKEGGAKLCFGSQIEKRE